MVAFGTTVPLHGDEAIAKLADFKGLKFAFLLLKLNVRVSPPWAPLVSQFRSRQLFPSEEGCRRRSHKQVVAAKAVPDRHETPDNYK